MTSPEGQATSLVRDSVVTCLVLVTVYADTIDQTLGALPPPLLQKLDECLKVALGLP